MGEAGQNAEWIFRQIIHVWVCPCFLFTGRLFKRHTAQFVDAVLNHFQPLLTEADFESLRLQMLPEGAKCKNTIALRGQMLIDYL